MSREGIPVFVDISQASSGRRSEGSAGVCGGGGGLGGEELNRMFFCDGASDLVCPAWNAQLGRSK